MGRAGQLIGETNTTKDSYMKRQLLLILVVAAMAMPAAAGLFSAKGDNAEEKRAAVRKDREAILAKLYRRASGQRDKRSSKRPAMARLTIRTLTCFS